MSLAVVYHQSPEIFDCLLSATTRAKSWKDSYNLACFLLLGDDGEVPDNMVSPLLSWPPLLACASAPNVELFYTVWATLPRSLQSAGGVTTSATPIQGPESSGRILPSILDKLREAVHGAFSILAGADRGDCAGGGTEMPLVWAVRNRQNGFAELLRAHGASDDDVDVTGETAKAVLESMLSSTLPVSCGVAECAV